MFGCMSYATRVTLADGTQEKIGKIVNQRQDVEVLSYDPESGRIIPRRIVNWFQQRPYRAVPPVHRGQVRWERQGPVRSDREPPCPHAGRLARSRRADPW